MKKILYILAITVFMSNFSLISVLADEKESVVVAPVESELYEVLQQVDLNRVSATEVALLMDILPKEIVTIAGTTVATTGAVISTPILIGVCIVMATVGVGLTAYNFWKYYNKMHPTENEDGTVTFHPNINSTLQGEVVEKQGIKWYKQSIYFDSQNYPEWRKSYNWMSLGTFPMPMTQNSSLIMFAKNKYFDESKGEWIESHADQDHSNSESNGFHNILVSINSSKQQPMGTIDNTVENVSSNRMFIDSYLSVWKPQEPLYKLVKLKKYTFSTKYRYRIHLGADHWSSLTNALKGTFNNYTYANLESEEDTFNTFSIWMTRPSVAGLTAPRYYGIDLYTKIETEVETPIEIPPNIKENQDFIVKVPTVQEWHDDETRLEPKPEIMIPTEPDKEFNPFPELPGTEIEPSTPPEDDTETPPEQEPETPPEQEPDTPPEDDTPSDTPPDEELGDLDTEIDLSPLFISLGEKFPFCIPFDLKRQIDNFQAEQKAPIFKVDMSAFDTSGKLMRDGAVLTLDLTIFEKLFLVVRYFILISFCIYLMIKTRDLIRG